MNDVHNSRNEEPCPYGPELQRYWAMRNLLLSRFDEGVQTDAVGLYCVKPEPAARQIAHELRGEVVYDAFCGIGGSAISFALEGKRVIAVEHDQHRLAMAIHNAAVYEVADKIRFIHGDSLRLLADCRFDCIYLDPFWGWPSASGIDAVFLDGLNPPGKQIIDRFLPLRVPTAMSLPRCFDLAEVRDLGIDFDLRWSYLEARRLFMTLFFFNRAEPGSTPRGDIEREGQE